MTTVSCAIDLEAPVWRIEEIAAYLRLPSIKSAYPMVQHRAFPRSIVPGKRNRRWLSAEVKEFFASRPAVHEPIKAIQTANSEPQIIHKNRKAKAA